MWVGVAFALVGCAAGPVREPRPANPELADGVEIRMGSDEMDVLFVVDNSNSMREEQMGATSCLGNPFAIAFSSEDVAAIGSLRVGFLSTDMGADPAVPTCEDPDGDDGVLLHEPSRAVVGCAPEYPTFLTWEAAEPDDGFGSDFECLEMLGTGGCGWEQPLAAVEKALGVHSRPGGPNEGFLRPDSLLLVVVLSDEDDCSIADPAIFGADESLGSLNLRCFFHPEAVRPVEEFVDALIDVRPADRLAIAAIVGVPPISGLTIGSFDAEFGDAMTASTFDAILADPAMQERIDDSPQGGGNRLVPSCDVPGLGIAFPPRRIVEWVRSLDAKGAGGLVQTLCGMDFSDVDRTLAALIRSRQRGLGCLGGLLRDAGGRALETGEPTGCRLTETLADDGACPAGRERIRVDEGRSVCAAGNWTYVRDPVCQYAGRVVFDPGAEPAPTSTLRLTCD